MARIRRFVVSQVEGNDANATQSDEIRPYGEIGLFEGQYIDSLQNDRLELLIFDGTRTHLRSKVLSPGRFYGYDADSGDGLNRDTIKLIPDTALYAEGSDQYLIIDPTGGEPGHIHVRAGGNIDQSGADLFLGGETNHVRVSDVGDYVRISVDNNQPGTYEWTFDASGNLNFPGFTSWIGESEPGLVVYSNNGFAVLADANGDSKSWIFRSDGNLTLPNSATIRDTGTVVAAGTIITVPVNAADDTEDYVGGASLLEIPKNTDTNQVQAGWVITFSNDVQRTVTEVVDGGSYWAVLYAESNPGLGSNTYPLTIQSADYAEAAAGSLIISLSDANNDAVSYSFGSDGNLITSSNLVIGPIPGAGSVISQDDAPLTVIATNANGGAIMGWAESTTGPGNVATIGFNSPAAANGIANVAISTGNNGGTQYDWVFGNDANLTVPGSIIAMNASPNPKIDGFSFANIAGSVAFDSGILVGNVGITFGDSSVQTTAWTGSDYGDSNVSSLLSSFGSNTISTTGNVTVGNLLTAAGGDVILGNATSNLQQAGSNASVNLSANITLTPDTAQWPGNGVIIGGSGFLLGPNGSRNAQLNYNGTNGLMGFPRINLYGSEATAIAQGGTSGTGNIGASGSRFNILYAVGGDFTGNVTATGNVSGAVLVSTNSVGDEGGEINLAASQNATIDGVIIDSYNDVIRIFENGGSSRGVRVDLTKAPAGNAGELLWKVSGFVDAGSFVTLDNLKATVSSGGNRGLSIAAVSGSFTADIGGFYGGSGGSGGDSVNNLSVTTSESGSLFSWNFVAEGNTAQYTIFDNTNTRVYRVTLMIGPAYLNNFISIEKLF